MLKTYLKYFHDQIGDVQNYDLPNTEILEKYKGYFKTDKDEFDIIYQLWLQDGFSSYRNGLFWLIDPDVYTKIAHKFNAASKSSVAFARSAMGGIFLFDKKDIGDSIEYLNPHLNNIKIISTSFQVFISMDVTSTSFWKRECYGKFEINSIEKYGTLAFDECYSFVPALALGGSEKVEELHKVKIFENLDLLSQLHN